MSSTTCSWNLVATAVSIITWVPTPNRLLFFDRKCLRLWPQALKKEYLNGTVPSENMQAERVGLHSEISQADMIRSGDPHQRSTSTTRVKRGHRPRNAPRPRQRTRRSVRRYSRGSLDNGMLVLFKESLAAGIPPRFYGKCVRFTFDYQEHLALSEVAFEAQTLVAADEAVAFARLRALLPPTPAPPAATLLPTTASTTRPTTPMPVQVAATPTRAPGPVQPNVPDTKPTPPLRPHPFSTPRAPLAPVRVAPVDSDRAGLTRAFTTEAMGEELYEDEEEQTTKQTPIVESARLFFAKFTPLVIGFLSVLLLSFLVTSPHTIAASNSAKVEREAQCAQKVLGLSLLLSLIAGNKLCSPTVHSSRETRCVLKSVTPILSARN